MPTFVELAGAKYPAERSGHKVEPMEGRSFAPILRAEKPAPRGPLFWEFRDCKAVRSGSWKIVTQGPERSHVNIPIKPGHEKWELYDMESDRCETRDLAKEHPEKVSELDALWQYWYRRCTT